MITQDVSSPALARLPLKISMWKKWFCPVSFQNKKRDSYLFHVSVVHGVVRHFIWLQFNNLFEFIAIAFPLADNDHFIEQEYIPEDIHTHSRWASAIVAVGWLYFSHPWGSFSVEFELTGPVSFGWRWSTPSALRRSLASRTPPVSPAA